MPKKTLLGLAPLLIVAVALGAVYARSAYRGYLRASLFEAIDRGDAAEIKRLLDRGADPNAIDNAQTSGFRGMSALTRAVSQRHSEVVRALLEKGAKSDGDGRSSMTPLGLAVGHRDIELVRLLLDHGADPNRRWIAGTPLSRASYPIPSPAIYRLLRDAGAKVPLDIAIQNDDLPMVRQLLSEGANANASSQLGATALGQAAFAGRLRIVEALLAHGADPNAAGNGGVVPLHSAISGRSLAVVRALVAAGCDINAKVRGATALESAKNQISMIRTAPLPASSLLRGDSADVATSRLESIVAFLQKSGAKD